mmetsp:Transcript_2410/g.6099  ORF Transcript_2410/g.6099 Transcript_2410/m.6099 type:complete len:214 (+) Transcript_2410:284-925(+)
MFSATDTHSTRHICAAVPQVQGAGHCAEVSSARHPAPQESHHSPGPLARLPHAHARRPIPALPDGQGVQRSNRRTGGRPVRRGPQQDLQHTNRPVPLRVLRGHAVHRAQELGARAGAAHAGAHRPQRRAQRHRARVLQKVCAGLTHPPGLTPPSAQVHAWQGAQPGGGRGAAVHRAGHRVREPQRAEAGALRGRPQRHLHAGRQRRAGEAGGV